MYYELPLRANELALSFSHVQNGVISLLKEHSHFCVFIFITMQVIFQFFLKTGVNLIGSIKKDHHSILLERHPRAS